MITTALLTLGLAALCAHAAPTGPAKRDSGTKAVFAHFMVGFTDNYAAADWAEDITAAHNAGIDGFALNVGSDSWQPSQVAAAYQAAESSGTGFKLFLSLDMSSLSCASPSDAANLRNWVSTYSGHPNQFYYNGRIFVSTFAGESCTFGQSSVSAGWSSQFTSQLTGSNAVYFVPSFFVDPATFNQYSIDGAFNFNSGWPISLTTDTANQQLSADGESLSNTSPSDEEEITQILLPNVGAIGTDQQYVSGLGSVTSQAGGPTAYMGAVSPWFFTHYGPDSYNKNWIYYADSHLYNTRWENIIANRDLFDLVEIVTWNDYSESHYIGPIHGDQPGSQDWVNGFDHTAWLNMTAYYVSAYKTGSYPTVTEDAIFIWARPHPKNANAPDPVPKPTNYEMAPYPRPVD
ncbi:hypothetical protein NM688_g9057 [Phlebia brevispora]|uniref:Uncharacterized protein n=1 Tax=Phlebia brevispora TaxID=194682 RepID=A0ACC1RJU8_9APHY|nr:hypothetical protein NM688_g9057 [Phlebia brevispora]